MLFPDEIRVARQCSGFPSLCGHGSLSRIHRNVTNWRSTQLVWREILLRLCEPLVLVARVKANCLHMKARHVDVGLVCRSRPDHTAPG